MIRKAPPPPRPAPDLPRAPGWARAVERLDGGVGLEAAFAAGAALAVLDAIARDAPVWDGVWRRRLALRAAAASLRAMGKREDEAALRDAWGLRRPGDDPGPAGRVYAAWRSLCGPADPLTEPTLVAAAEGFGAPLADPEGLLMRLRDVGLGGSPPPLAAAQAAREAYRARPDCEPLAHWCADAVLGARLRLGGKPAALPLLAAELARFRNSEGRKPRPEDADWAVGCCHVYARAALSARDLAADLATRAAKLVEVAPKLRAKASDRVVAAMLDDDALTASVAIRGISDRGLRRLFDRLVALGAARELTGRDTFRLYGL